MFEKEIKFIADFSLNKIKNLGSFFTFERLASIDIHPAIIRYISAELDYLIYEDRRKLLQQSVFDYSGPEISNLFVKVNEQIKRTKRISYEDIKKLVMQAVSFNVNFIARPKWSLSKLVYDTADNKPVEEIKLMFNYLFYYEYIKNIFLSYLNKRKITTLSLVEFELIINKIDKEIFGPEQSKKLIDNALYAMADFFNVGGTGKTKISPAPLEIFLKEKNLIDFLFRLRRALPPAAKSTYEVEELRKVIYSTEPLEQQQILITEEEPVQPTAPEKKVLKPEQKEKEIETSELDTMSKELASEFESEIIYNEEIPVIEEIDEVPEEVELKSDELIIEEPETDDELLKMYDEELRELERLLRK